MNYSKAVFLINPDVRAVAATYESDENAKRSVFKTFDPSIAVGDYCVVPTDTRHKMSVVKVVEVDIDIDMDSPEHLHWIVMPIDRDGYEKVVANEQKAIQAVKSAELRQKREKLRDAMLANHLDELKTLEISKIDDAPKPAA